MASSECVQMSVGPSYGQWALGSAVATPAEGPVWVSLSTWVGAGRHHPTRLQEQVLPRWEFSPGVHWVWVVPCVVSAASLSRQYPVLLIPPLGRAQVLWGAASEALMWGRWPQTVGGLGLSRGGGRPLAASPALDFQLSFVRREFVNFLSS